MNLENYGNQTTVLVGPWGGQQGLDWDDGVYSTVRQIEIRHGAVIDSIRIEYDVNGRSIWSETHGGCGSTMLDKVRLDYPDEYLISVSGYYGILHEHGPVLVRSLTFETNKRSYGPFGVEQGMHFASPKTQGKIIGFHGKSGWYLDAIGAYVEPLPIQNSVHSQQYLSNATDKYDYSMSMVQGNNYDVILAVRQKDDRNMITSYNLSPPIISHHDYYSNIGGTNESKNNQVFVPRNLENKIESKSVQGIVASGPWGGAGGTTFDDGVYDGVRQIKISRNLCIVSIKVCYDKNGQPVLGIKNGGRGSFKKNTIVFDYPSEILTHITGYIGHTMVMGPSVIKSLTFHTTKGKHGPYGEEEGEFFSTKLKEGAMIVGFHGRKGLFLDAIGVHVLEGKVVPHYSSSTTATSSTASTTTSNKKVVAVVSPTSTTTSSAPRSSNQTALVAKKADKSDQWPFKIGIKGQTDDQVIHRTVKDPAPYGTGPWGGEGGKPWDDGVFTGIKQIIITITDAICCMEIEYDRNGQSIWSVKHGGSGGQIANRVKLDYPNEVLTCVSGYYSPIKKEQGCKVIQSLTFHTSRKKYGPFGEEIGTYFTSGTTEGKVVGFHGRSSTYLDAMGVHMQHWLGSKRSPYKGSSKMKMFSS